MARMTPLTIIYVTDMARALTFYQAVGFTVRSQSEMWSEMEMDGCLVALHGTDRPASGPPAVGLALNAHVPLEQLAAEFTTSGVPMPQPIQIQPFGRSLLIQDPDGLLIQINEHQ